MKSEDGIIPLTALNPACQRFLNERRDSPAAYQERLDALTMVHTAIVFGEILLECRQRRGAWFPHKSMFAERQHRIRFGANAEGLVEFKDRMDLPLPVVWEAAIAFYGAEAVSLLEGDSFTIRLSARVHR